MDLLVSMAAVVCTVAAVSMVAELIQTLLYAGRTGLSLRDGYVERHWRSGKSVLRLQIWFGAVALSLVVLLAASGNIRHIFGSKALRHQPDGTYAYTIETGEGDLPGVIEIISVPSKLVFTAGDGTRLTDRSKSFYLTRLERPGGELVLEKPSEISQHGTVYLLTEEGESVSIRLLDAPAVIAGYTPTMHRGLFYWLDIIVPIPVAIYLVNLWAAIKIRKKESIEKQGEREHG